MATAAKGGGARLALELGDILYELDERVVSVTSRGFPDVVLVYTRLNPLDAFRRVAAWPPAYAQRVVPAVLHLEESLGAVERGIELLLSLVERGEVVYIEVVYRGSRRLEEEARRLVERVARRSGLRVSRRGATLDVKLECGVGEFCVAALMPHRCDRVALWLEEGVTRVCGPLIV